MATGGEEILAHLRLSPNPMKSQIHGSFTPFAHAGLSARSASSQWATLQAPVVMGLLFGVVSYVGTPGGVSSISLSSQYVVCPVSVRYYWIAKHPKTQIT